VGVRLGRGGGAVCVYGGADASSFEQPVQSGAADAEHLGGAELVAVDPGENKINVAQDGAIEIRVVFGGDGIGGRGRRAGRERWDIDRTDPLAFAFESCAVNDTFQLSNVARPGVRGETWQGMRSKATDGLSVGRGEATGEEVREEREIIAAFAQRRDSETNGGEPVAEVGAKTRGRAGAEAGWS
jgi:hypothetical protein